MIEPWPRPPYIGRSSALSVARPRRIYGTSFRQRVHHMGIKEVPTAPHSPWQKPDVERLIGSIRRECLDYVMVLHERHLQRILSRYFVYYHRFRTHLSLALDCPEPRPV